MDETKRTQMTVVQQIEAGIERIGFLDTTVDVEDLLEDEEFGNEISSFPKDEFCADKMETGNLCEGRRLDYMLQEKEIESANEYISALAAHSSYWNERDLSLFLARQLKIDRPL